MAKCEFSETQFVFSYIYEYLRKYEIKYPLRTLPFWFPTTVKEPEFGSDILIANLKSITFIQFKRSEYMNKRRGKREILSKLKKSFLPYYRFEVYNSGSIPQFERLRDIAAISKSFKVYYCAPKFISIKEFQNIFWSRSIIDNSVLIDCQQFNQSGFKLPKFNINDGDKHFMVFNNTTRGYLCSKKKGFTLVENPLNEKPFNREFDYNIINNLFDYLKEADPEVGDYNRGGNIDGAYNKLQFCINHLHSKYGIQTFLKYNSFNE